MWERYIVSREFRCGIGILHKMVDFSGVVSCDVGKIVSEKCLFEGGNFEIGKDVVQSA